MQNSPLSCIKCGDILVNDDIGATKKLINRGSTEFLCIPCLAKHFNVTEELIRRKIEEYRAYGCSLFAN
ncbi:MAG: hypothetical protein CVU97_04425 [Firmicutes bacterium HGW-Firmicutes-21]|nr:MAG: hypothetical protein CVU97_04425 [Firmicutes bacterium HGW-Firmicutes-21]